MYISSVLIILMMIFSPIFLPHSVHAKCQSLNQTLCKETNTVQSGKFWTTSKSNSSESDSIRSSRWIPINIISPIKIMNKEVINREEINKDKYIQSGSHQSQTIKYRRPIKNVQSLKYMRSNHQSDNDRRSRPQSRLKISSSQRRNDVVKKYTNNIFIRVHPRTLEQLNLLLQLEHVKEIKLWNAPKIGQLVLLHLNPVNEVKVINSLRSVHLEHFIITKDLQSLIDSQISSYINKTRAVGFSYENYNRYTDIMTELSKLSRKHSRYVHYESIGKSYEGRDIPAIALSFNGRFKRPAVFIECGIHSREWISPASCLWIINHLITIQPKMVKSFDYHFIVIANPDGYEYTWNHDRLWRKNRRLTKNQAYHKRLNPSIATCQGIDINRNFDISFSTDGATRLPCQDNYCGDVPFSEPESLAIRNYVMKVTQSKGIKVYIAVHSYSQMWMYPRGYSSLLPPNYHQLARLSKAAAYGIYRTHGKVYKTGPISHVICK